MKKSLMSAVAACALTAAVLAVPTAAHAAKPLIVDRYSESGSEVVTDCGFPMQVDFTIEGRYVLRENKTGGPGLEMDNYKGHETITANGRTATIDHQGMFKNSSITLVEGTTYQFTGMESGQPFVVRAEDGTVLLRDRGLLRTTLQLETFGIFDREAGADRWVFIEDSFEVLADHGRHDGFYDSCTVLEEYFFG